MRRLVLIAVLAALIVPVFTASARAHTVRRAIIDPRLVDASAADRDAYLDEIANDLHARSIRLDVIWSSAEPTQGVYNETYLAAVKAVADAATTRGLSVIVTVIYTPKWASNRSLWDTPPAGYDSGVYFPFYAMDMEKLPDFRSFATHLATTLGPTVNRYECWNEPNLWPYIYPQRTDGDKFFAARIYAKMLRSFSRGIGDGNADALIVGGATAPIGGNHIYSTTPTRFARFLKDAHAGRYFDIYSHHPYTPGGSLYMAPGAPPNDTRTTVTLNNLKTLLKLFPGKPFYLTEYGYNSSPSNDFGGGGVSETAQATYLRRAYAFAGRYSQVKVLMWYLLKDSAKSGAYDSTGVYTGLRRLNGSRKPSWYYFVGGSHLSLNTPTNAASGKAFWINGAFTNSRLTDLSDVKIVVQRHYPGGDWTTVTSDITNAAGKFRVSVKQARAAQWRVAFQGVAMSPVKSVGSK